MLFVAIYGSTAFGQVNLPEGFEIVEFMASEYLTNTPSINQCGQIAFARRLGPPPWDAEIFLYDNGKIVRLTDNRGRDVGARINDEGTIVWSRGLGKRGVSQVILYEDGVETILDDHRRGAISGGINSLGHVAWSRIKPSPCPLAQDILFWDGADITRITPKDDFNDQSPELNDDDWIVWGHSDNCENPWVGEIRLYRDGETLVLPSGGDQPGGPEINNLGQIAWDAGLNRMELWENGRTRVLIEGNGPEPSAMNNLGDIFFLRWYEENRTWDAWVYRVSREQGEPTLHRLTEDVPWDNAGDINDWGEIAWGWTAGGGNFAGGIRFMRRVRTGDSEFDGDIDLGDYGTFAECMTGPGRVDRLCECRFLDIDHDGDVDLGDFALFQIGFTGEK